MEFIKRAVNDAAGFKITNSRPGAYLIYTPCGSFAFSHKRPLDEDFWMGAGSLLLQRAIEGINENSKNWIIEQDPQMIIVYFQDYTERTDFFITPGKADECKRASLEFIYRQEIM